MERMTALQPDLLLSSLSFTSPICFIEDNVLFKCGGSLSYAFVVFMFS